MPEETKPSSAKVEIVDHAAEQAKREKAEQDKADAQRRASHVAALQNELDYLNRTPNPAADRVAAVEEQLAEYSDKPTARKRETR
jgi:predicted  nucleic acid-binding Zn-ribbon protein